MVSQTFLFFGLLLAVLLMMSSEVVARELAETSPALKLDNENEADVDGYHGGGYHKGGGYKKCRYRCKGHCCSYEEYVAMGEVTETSPAVKLDNENEADVDGYHGGGYHKGGGYKKCRYRCKGHCCSYEEYVAMGEVTETSPAVKLDNENEADVDGYHGGGYRKGGGYKKCSYRCKGYCCSYEEYVAMKKVTQAKPQN